MINWIQNLFSIEERKTSTIMFSFVLFSLIGAYTILKTNQISMESVYIILGLSGYICGYNVVPHLLGSKENFNTTNYSSTTTPTYSSTLSNNENVNTSNTIGNVTINDNGSV